MEKLEIINNEVMADDRPVPMDLEKVGAHDARTTQSDQDASNDMSYDEVMEQARRDQTEQDRGIEEKELMNGRVANETMEERWEAGRAPRAANLNWYGDKDTGSNESKFKGRGKGKSENSILRRSRRARAHQYKWTNIVDEEGDQGSSWVSEPVGEKPEEPASLEAPDD